MSKTERIDASDPKNEYFLDQFQPFTQAEILGEFARFGSEAEEFILMLKRPKTNLKEHQMQEPPLPTKKLSDRQNTRS